MTALNRCYPVFDTSKVRRYYRQAIKMNRRTVASILVACLPILGCVTASAANTLGGEKLDGKNELKAGQQEETVKPPATPPSLPKPKTAPVAPQPPTGPKFAPPTFVNYLAETTKPATKIGVVPAAGISWRCRSDRCETSGRPMTPSVKICVALATQVGALRSFSIGDQHLSSGDLARCNASYGGTTKPGTGGFTLQTPKPTTRGFAPAAPSPTPGTGSHIRTSAIVAVGTGAPLTPRATAGRTIRTAEIRAEGTGAPLTPPERAPVTIHTSPINATATGSLP